VQQVSCGSAGNCVAAGVYLVAPEHPRPFVSDETNGAWQHALAIPGLAKLATAFGTTVNSLSCASAGN
jgi:hypothetical protein